MKIFANSYTCYSYHILPPLSNKSVSLVWRGESCQLANIPRLPRTHLLKRTLAHVCVCVCACACGQLQCGEFARHSVNIPDNTAVAGRLLCIKFLIFLYIFITHKSRHKENHLLIPFIAGNKHLKLQILW